MEVGEDGKKLQREIPWVPQTPLKPILSKPVPIYTSREENQDGSYFNASFSCFEAEINGRSHPLPESVPEPVANVAGDNDRTRVKISFDNTNGSGSGSSNGFSEVLGSTRYHEFLMNEFGSSSNFNSQFNPMYMLLPQNHFSQELPLINTINNNQDPQGAPYSAYYSEDTSQFATANPDCAIRLDSRHVAEMQMNIVDGDQRGSQRNVTATMCNNNQSPLNKEFCDSVVEHAASTPCKETGNHNEEISNVIDLNETPQLKPKRRKHRPKVIKESKPKSNRKPVTPKSVPPGEIPTSKRKHVRRKSSTPQTEVIGEQTEPSIPASAEKTCKRSLNFDIGEQPRDENPACSENATTYFGCENGMATVATQTLNNYRPLHEDTQAHDIHLSTHGAKPNANSAESSGKRKGLMTPLDGHGNNAKMRSSLNDSNSGSHGMLTTGIQMDGSKRKQYGTNEHPNSGYPNLIGAHYNAMQAYGTRYWIQFPNVQKKRRSDIGKNSNTSNTYSGTATKDVRLPTWPQDVRLQQTKRRSSVPAPIHDWGSLALTTNYDNKLTHTAQQLGSYDRQSFGDAERPHTCVDALVEQTGAPLTKKKRTKKRSTLVSSAYSCTSAIQQHCKFSLENHSLQMVNSSGVAREEMWKNIHTVDALTEVFTHLNIHTEARELVLHGQNALVPYNQQSQNHKGLVQGYGTIVPYEAFDPVRKHRPRPKVDLDEETNKVWKLLMLDINSHGVDGTDEAKAKWWEDERNVFRGRADSFIARMHLVQGDRRFSPWKGSVVDSVVGVFLTQNVSDHLSSSAFMSLAARFPLKPTSNYKTFHEESASLTVNEPQVHIVEPEENIFDQTACELGSTAINFIEHPEEKEAVNSNDSGRTSGSLIILTDDESNCKPLEPAQREIREQHSPVESGQISATTEEGQENSCHTGVRKELNDVVSSQCSVITSQISGHILIDQNPEKMGSSSDSNSEVEDLSCTAKYNDFCDKISFTKLLEMASSTMVHEVDSERSKSNEIDPLKTEVSSSGLSKNKDENDTRGLSFPIESENQATIAHSPSLLSQFHLQEQSNHEQQHPLQILEQTQDSMQKATEINFGGNNYAMNHENSKITSAPIKSKSKEPGKEKKDEFKWDILRIQAQDKAGKREKTKNTLDSLDWDAVRCADVREIADAIKERGMNNMLAERIQSFLNRLVDVHGAIDLEWLRDVPPDQAKEYLLSIRGLGLKSVECVRLLTLHHLAFPVDTNVGRIAVRLGWVPLQPLPESLQLHLLELYPVLESIQKYLWPRLCKLDQRTLYELHYQLITFGKVFCTKSKPNCNSCPMRGECRHFASAFASARLALPGPEQRSIVMQAGNSPTYPSPSVIMNRLPLPLLESSKQPQELGQTEVSRQLEATSGINICQPIIEEPATPEPECSHVTESDIEDAFFEDSCEIPSIKLNMEEFTLNLQNYMEENMELQDGEMSKALVALNPEAACIPTPKLKNVSRLRTEHCVYELPDSHPLLEGWETRETDDPGKYLLAIWTPGETPNSIQPPETKCSSQDCGQLCNEKECFSCNSFREANSQTVRGTILIPCRTAMRGSFPLNGTYFQVNEVFAEHESSLNPMSVPRSWIWNLNRRTVYFGTSVPSIFKGLTTPEIQQCFWRGYVCVRGFDRATRAPRPLMARLHFPASKLAKNKENRNKKASTSANSQGLNLETNPQPEQPQELLLNIENLFS
ncbi:putative DNA glycosylase, helix-turn-helix, base-excision DNA repair, demeter [Lupinus albus]|uniref:Putative DNA glycosylase, helix-turn-helix, base-excision DNA repair, demeter n=1 Tax=Lupinus albus TaxID=3870 RepID=A0A6A4R9C5_LUPAL|nr:putative DNA glycosylase, helix-turn-helix, base-excision DNA repair, demeter [Lupinus albus]